ncbi:hypothetical protein B0H19DRAFT_1066852 [Mycena capillaripes]|nr:hypothetical protein B0H19DRAFT_1066852 [Mycena capillaripes]
MTARVPLSLTVIIKNKSTKNNGKHLNSDKRRRGNSSHSVQALGLSKAAKFTYPDSEFNNSSCMHMKTVSRTSEIHVPFTYFCRGHLLTFAQCPAARAGLVVWNTGHKAADIIDVNDFEWLELPLLVVRRVRVALAVRYLDWANYGEEEVTGCRTWEVGGKFDDAPRGYRHSKKKI